VVLIEHHPANPTPDTIAIARPAGLSHAAWRDLRTQVAAVFDLVVRIEREASL
jgi:hypothetical protein